MKATIIISGISLLVTIMCRAETYEIKLGDVYGNYIHSEIKQFHIDLETDFEAIHEARFQCRGTIVTDHVPGVFNTYLGENRPGKIPGQVVLDGYRCATGTVVSNNSPERFNCDVLFRTFRDDRETWDFLFDGEADGFVQLFHTGGYIHTQQYTVAGNINSACIVISATPVPEPSVYWIAGVCVCYLIKISGLL